MGLVKQAVSALTKRKIMQLTHTYITLPLSGKPGIPAQLQFARATAVRSYALHCLQESLLAHYLNETPPRIRVQISPTRWDWRTPMMPKATS